MKKFLFLAVALFALTVSSCNNSNDTANSDTVDSFTVDTITGDTTFIPMDSIAIADTVSIERTPAKPAKEVKKTKK